MVMNLSARPVAGVPHAAEPAGPPAGVVVQPVLQAGPSRGVLTRRGAS